ncbi:MAG: PEGA domain-containing protein [Methanoregula sp.]|nr:PEGA domain-containing protein [Methanoregula sp.]
MLQKIAICLLVLGVFLCGCTAPLPEKTGSIKITSSPSGAEVYLDNEYHGTTPNTITTVQAGNHTVEIRERGYKTWSQGVSVTSGSSVAVSASLVPVGTTVPTIVPTIIATMTKKDVPDIHVDGFWTYPAVRSFTNPEPLLVNVYASNVGYADAREVTTSANMYLYGKQICWTKVYLGTIKAGGHVTKEAMMYCSIPSDGNSQNLEIKFENIVITP